ncbi:hypothetical protein FACS1894161_2930 [Spirochaetia bacterium]|nr:hypothetical protein FACS1894161_2930 [Spirochaetia bacterium]
MTIPKTDAENIEKTQKTRPIEITGFNITRTGRELFNVIESSIDENYYDNT